MELQNDKCNVKINIDTTYTIDSMDNKFYDIELNLSHIEHNDFYKVFSITIDLFYKQFHIALVGDYHSY